ncbi:MAG TPA: diacylglycerol kinase family protein [Anaerolineales bacterium]|jgi:diacylglycerol kinase family enzyme|nr:diacylglycerol kinase family protein [Anaerolineales bacterium]
MMHATLVFNPQARRASKFTPEVILEALKQAGYDTTYTPTSSEDDLDGVLQQAKDFVVVAGGDGSIRAVATRLLKRNIPIVPLPLGTANNIARTLSINGNPQDIIAGLADPAERILDVGCVTTPKGPNYFLEAMGIGVFADILEKYNPENGKSIGRAIQTLLKTLNDYQPKFFHVNVDGQDFSGSYLLFEVMNTPTMGFHYQLAPEAKPDDGLFDLVLIHANEREKYVKFIKSVLTGTLETLPDVSIQKGRKLEIAWRGFPLHLDGLAMAGKEWMGDNVDEVHMEEPELLDVSKPYLQVEIMPEAIHFLVPKSTIAGN